MNPDFERTIPVKFKHNHVLLVATDDEEKKLRHELLVTGCAIDVKDYTPKHNDNLEPGKNNIMGMYTIINLWHEFT